MKLIRFLSLITFICLVPVFLVMIVLFNLRLFLFNSENILRAANDAKIYEVISNNTDYLAKQILKDNENPFITEDVVAVAIKEAFPPEFVRKETEAQIKGFFDFMEGKEDELHATDISSNKGAIRKAIVGRSTPASLPIVNLVLDESLKSIPDEMAVSGVSLERLENIRENVQVALTGILLLPIIPFVIITVLAFFRTYGVPKKNIFRAIGWYTFIVNMLFLIALFLFLTISSIIKVIVLPELKMIPDFIKADIFMPIAANLQTTLFKAALIEFFGVLFVSLVILIIGYKYAKVNVPKKLPPLD